MICTCTAFLKMGQVYIFFFGGGGGDLKLTTAVPHICESGMRKWSVGMIWSKIKVLDLQE